MKTQTPNRSSRPALFALSLSLLLAACPVAPAEDEDAGTTAGDSGQSTSCQTAEDCPAGQGCRAAEGECDACRVAGECRAGEACVDGACGGCTDATQCDGALCSGGACVACVPGTDDAACAMAYADAEYACNPDGRCGPHACTSTADCQIARQICDTTGRCVPCEDSFDCTGGGYPAGTLCVDGECKGADCLEHEDCIPDRPICGTDSRCRGCQADLECTLATQLEAVCETSTGRCFEGDCATNDTPCGSPDADRLCVEHICTDCATTPQCVAVFGDGVLCNEGHCISGNCLSDLDCDGGQRICGPSNYCRDCVFGSDDCGLGRVCSDGLCHTGDCAPPGTPCGTPELDMICTDFVCSACGSDPQCQAVFGSGFLCLGGHCVGGDCQTDQDCDGGQRICSNNNFCRSCLLGSDECGVDRVCGADGRCHDGECYPPATECCDATGHFQLDTFRCDSLAVDTEYRCENTSCGADAQYHESFKYCSGTSAACDLSNVQWHGWTINEACGSDQLCESSALGSWCVDCDHGCASGACFPDCNPSERCCSTTGAFYDCWYDSTSGIEWQEPPVTTTYAYRDAQDYCRGLTLGGYDDWNVPSPSELRSLIRGCSATVAGGDCNVTDLCFDTKCYDEADCNGDLQACFPSAGPGQLGCYQDPILAGSETLCNQRYWSCYGPDHEYWTVNFHTAEIEKWYLIFDGKVRCLRGGICN